MSSQYKITVKRNEYRGFPIARMQISVGAEYHEAGKLKAVVDWVSRHFEASSINLCDSLQRHNLKFQQIADPETKAIMLGDEWLKRNGETLSKLPELKVTRWNDWRNSPDYLQALQRTLTLHDAADGNLKQIVDRMCEGFWERQKSSEAISKVDFIKASRLYILEETAITQLMSEPEIAEIYPGTFPETIGFLKEKGLNAPQSMTTLGFKRRKQPQVA